MKNNLFNELNPQNNFNMNQFMQDLNHLKEKGGDPNQMIQNLLNSGRVTQDQLNSAVNRAQWVMRMLTPSAHR